MRPNTVDRIAQKRFERAQGKTFSDEDTFSEWLNRSVLLIHAVDVMEDIWAEEHNTPRGRAVFADWAEDGAPEDMHEAYFTFGRMLIRDQVVSLMEDNA